MVLKKLFGRTDEAAWRWMETDELLESLNGTAAPLVIDVRGPDEFTGPLGHVDGARNIPLDQLPAAAPGLLVAVQPIVLICHTDRRSASGAALLACAGVQRLAVVRGGMVAWRSAGH